MADNEILIGTILLEKSRWAKGRERPADLLAALPVPAGWGQLKSTEAG